MALDQNCSNAPDKTPYIYPQKAGLNNVVKHLFKIQDIT